MIGILDFIRPFVHKVVGAALAAASVWLANHVPGIQLDVDVLATFVVLTLYALFGRAVGSKTNPAGALSATLVDKGIEDKNRRT